MSDSTRLQTKYARRIRAKILDVTGRPTCSNVVLRTIEIDCVLCGGNLRHWKHGILQCDSCNSWAWTSRFRRLRHERRRMSAHRRGKGYEWKMARRRRRGARLPEDAGHVSLWTVMGNDWTWNGSAPAA